MSDYDIFLRRYVPPKAYKETLDKAFGEAWTGWEPETIIQEIFRAFRVVPINSVREKIFALQTFLVTNHFWLNAMTFEDMVLAFGDRYVDPGLLQVCLPEEVAYGVTVAEQVRKEPYEEEVLEYIRACHQNSGILVYHDVLRFAQPEYKDANAGIFATVAAMLARGDAPPEEMNHEDVIQVQYAKSCDVAAYVQERIERATMS